MKRVNLTLMLSGPQSALVKIGAMAFEAFPSEAVQQFNDPGPFYVRENGQLRSPPGMGPRSKSLLELSPETNPASTQANSTNHSQNIPRKLFDLTLDFVADNIVLVDSLVGFPEVVGQQLFEASHLHENLSMSALRLFSDAYGDTILQSMNLSGHHLAVNQHSNCLNVFPYLTELEVGHCCLGDNHEIISTIANCCSLTRLGLASNGLSDVGIQRLTSPLRVMGRGPRNLHILDLAGNNLISDKSARQYLTGWTSLQAIDLSGCNISSVGFKELKSKLRLETKTASGPSPFQPPVKTVGWALPLIEQWVASSSHLMERGKCKATKDQAHGTSNAISFYGRARKRLENISSSSLPRTKPTVFPIIQLVAVAPNHTQPTSDPADNKVKRSKVKMTIDRLTKGFTNPASCQQESEAHQSQKGVGLSQTTLDNELIQQYASGPQDKFSKNTSTGKQKHRSFFDIESDEPKQNRESPSLKQDPVRITKPPPKKRIKLTVKNSMGFSDVLHRKLMSDKEHTANQQASDWKKSCDQSHRTSEDCRLCPNQRHSVECCSSNRHLYSASLVDHKKCQNSEVTKQRGSGLWNAMNSKDWP